MYFHGLGWDWMAGFWRIDGWMYVYAKQQNRSLRKCWQESGVRGPGTWIYSYSAFSAFPSRFPMCAIYTVCTLYASPNWRSLSAGLLSACISHLVTSNIFVSAEPQQLDHRHASAQLDAPMTIPAISSCRRTGAGYLPGLSPNRRSSAPMHIARALLWFYFCFFFLFLSCIHSFICFSFIHWCSVFVVNALWSIVSLANGLDAIIESITNSSHLAADSTAQSVSQRKQL